MASSFLYSTIIEVCQKLYHSNDYNEFPEIILDSFPFTRGNQEITKQEIALCFSKLKTAGADLLCIASNSFHGDLPDISSDSFINLIHEGLKEASRLKISSGLIFGSQLTIGQKLYERSQMECLYPSTTQQQVVNQIIREVAGGTVS